MTLLFAGFGLVFVAQAVLAAWSQASAAAIGALLGAGICTWLAFSTKERTHA